jgi:hypothetical protein
VIDFKAFKHFSKIRILNWSEYQAEKDVTQTTHKASPKRHPKRHPNDTPIDSVAKGNSDIATPERHTKRHPNDTQSVTLTTTIKEDKKKEDKKKEFEIEYNLIPTVFEILKFDSSFSLEFIKYWTKQTEVDSELMRFERLEYFDFQAQIEKFKVNRKRFNKKTQENGNTKKETLRKEQFLGQINKRSK